MKLILNTYNILKHRLMTIIVVFIAFASTTTPVTAQTDVQMTQYWAVPTYYNPAAVGSTDYLRITGGAKLQWLGITNAPKSFFGVADMSLPFLKRRMGVGLNIQHEGYGLFSNLALNLQLSYKFKLFGGNLSVGAQVGYFDQKFKGSEVILPDDDDFHESTDEAIPTQDLQGNSIDISAGLYYNHKYFWFGVSGMHLLEPTIRYSIEGTESNESQEYESLLPRQLYFMGGSNIQIKNTLFEIQPSFMVRTDFSTFSAEITAGMRYNRFLSFGLGYRWKDAVMVMAGVEFKNFFIGYAYDYPLSAIAKASSGSHEIVASYKLKLDFSGKNKNKHRSIRIM